MNKYASILRKLSDFDLRFIGVQIVCALLCSQLSRIFSTIGADPLDLGYVWVIPPLTALLAIPGARMYLRLSSGAKSLCLVVCSLVAAVALWLLARAGSLGFTLSEAILFALIMLALLCAALSVPGDSYGRGIKGRIGMVAGLLAPAFLALFLSDTAPAGEVPAAVRWAFYIAAITLVAGAACTFVDSRLHQPYGDCASSAMAGCSRSRRDIPGVFWVVALIQFCSWAAFMFMWVYSTDALAAHSFGAPAEQRITGVVIDGREYSDKYLFSDGRPVVVDGYLHIAGFYIDGDWVEPHTLVIDGDTVMRTRNVLRNSAGQLKIQADPLKPVTVAKPGQTVRFDDYPELTVVTGVEAVSEFSLIEPSNRLVTSHLAHDKDNTGIYSVERPNRLPSVTSSRDIELQYTCRLNTASAQYQRAGDWTGLLMAVQAVVAMVWIMVIGRIRNRRLAYSVSLLLGALGFWSVGSFHSPGCLLLSWALMGCAWGAMMTLPSQLLQDVCPSAIKVTILIPQVIAALCGGWLIITTGHAADGAPATVCMFSVGAVLLIVGAAAVWLIRENGSKTVSHHSHTYAMDIKCNIKLLTGLLLLLLTTACNDDIFVDAPAGDEDFTAVVDGEGGEAEFFLSRKSLVSITTSSGGNNLIYYDRAGNIIPADSPVAEIACISCESIRCSWKIKIDGNSLHFTSIENCTGFQQIEYIRAVYDYGSDVVYVIYIEPGRPIELESLSYDGDIDVRHDATIRTDRFRFNNNSSLPQQYEFMPYLQAEATCVVVPVESWAGYETVTMALPVYEGGDWVMRDRDDVRLQVVRRFPFDLRLQKVTVDIEPMSNVLITSSIIYDEATATGTMVFRTPVSGRRLATAFSAITAWPVRNDIEVKDAQ